MSFERNISYSSFVSTHPICSFSIVPVSFHNLDNYRLMNSKRGGGGGVYVYFRRQMYMYKYTEVYHMYLPGADVTGAKASLFLLGALRLLGSTFFLTNWPRSI